MVADVEYYRSEDGRKRSLARNELEDYCYDVKQQVEEGNHPEKIAIVEMCEQTIKWLAQESLLPSVEEMAAKKEDIYTMVSSVLKNEFGIRLIK